MSRIPYTVLRGWPAVGLLVMRVAVAAAIASRRPASPPVEVCAAFLLLGGTWTTVVAALIAGLELWRSALQSGGWISVLLSAMAVALALIGPGGWSIDARFFGWRRIEIPSSRQRDGSAQFSRPTRFRVVTGASSSSEIAIEQSTPGRTPR